MSCEVCCSQWWWWCGRCACMTCPSMPHGRMHPVLVAEHLGVRLPASSPPWPSRPAGRSAKNASKNEAKKRTPPIIQSGRLQDPKPSSGKCVKFFRKSWYTDAKACTHTSSKTRIDLRSKSTFIQKKGRNSSQSLQKTGRNRPQDQDPRSIFTQKMRSPL